MTGKHSGLKSTRSRNYLSIFTQKNIMDFYKDSSITLIDKRDGSDPKGREVYWSAVPKTATPHGLNRVKYSY